MKAVLSDLNQSGDTDTIIICIFGCLDYGILAELSVCAWGAGTFSARFESITYSMLSSGGENVGLSQINFADM